ncbi:MAG: hypothetical protein ACYC6A_16325 [Armatimonadota bacterium]
MGLRDAGGIPRLAPGVREIPRAYRVCETVLPPLLLAVRAAEMPLFHVVSGNGYYEGYPGYARAAALAGPEPEPLPRAERDPSYDRLMHFRGERVFPGAHNGPDIERGWPALRFPREAEPHGNEGIAHDARQLFALCRDAGINHLIYAGFNIDWCLLMSEGGMVDMSRHGLICSALREAVTAVENRETARREMSKEISLWRVAVAFGFVFGVEDFIMALNGSHPHPTAC